MRTKPGQKTTNKGAVTVAIAEAAHPFAPSGVNCT